METMFNDSGENNLAIWASSRCLVDPDIQWMEDYELVEFESGAQIDVSGRPMNVI